MLEGWTLTLAVAGAIALGVLLVALFFLVAWWWEKSFWKFVDELKERWKGGDKDRTKGV